jgi:hypothetical protein
MPQVLTTKALIVCPHDGVGTSIPTAPNPKWSVNGGAVLLENDTGTLLGCQLLSHPCRRYTLRSMGLNATRVDGQRVILVTDFNRTQSRLPLRMTEFHTTMDNSTPEPIPAGQPAPPLSPALLDMVPPAVTVGPPTLAFNSVTMLPPTLATMFTLSSANPMQWVLTLINEPLGSDADVTNGLPPGLVVAPTGGGWNSATLAVTVTMTAAFMAALTPGRHHFYMTGVSQRGLSNYAEVVLTVS